MENSSPRIFVMLYILFFALWCVGLALGEMIPGPEQPALFGLPLWFMISCVFSYLIVSVALIQFFAGASSE